MATTFLQPGESLTMVAPTGGVTAGVGVLIGQIFGVALDTKAQTLSFELAIRGVFEVAKTAADEIAIGDALYWDDTAKEVNATSTAQKEVGYAVTAAPADTTTTVQIRLTPTVRTDVSA